MWNMVCMLILMFTALIAIFGMSLHFTGESGKGDGIISGAVTVLILYFLVVEMFSVDGIGGTVVASGIPFIESAQVYGGIKQLLTKAPGVFALDFVELVTLTVIINYASGYLSFGSGLAGKAISKLAVVLLSIIIYGFVMDMIRDNIMIRWCIMSVECAITGASLLYTPAMILAMISGLKSNNYAIVFLLKQFPKTSICRSITTAITCSVTFMGFLFLLENQYGSVLNVMHDSVEIVESMGGVIVMLIGIRIIMKSLFGSRT